jgi:hypothetical protein
VVLVKTTTVPVNWNTQNQLSVLSMTWLDLGLFDDDPTK